jgi:hypothetical protein
MHLSFLERYFQIKNEYFRPNNTMDNSALFRLQRTSKRIPDGYLPKGEEPIVARINQEFGLFISIKTRVNFENVTFAKHIECYLYFCSRFVAESKTASCVCLLVANRKTNNLFVCSVNPDIQNTEYIKYINQKLLNLVPSTVNLETNIAQQRGILITQKCYADMLVRSAENKMMGKRFFDFDLEKI